MSRDAALQSASTPGRGASRQTLGARFTAAMNEHPTWAALGIYTVFAALTAFVYRGLWSTLYYKDDYHWLSIAQEVARAPWRLVVSDEVNAAAGVRPVQRAVFGLIHALFGVRASAYHVASMLLHAANATLIFYLLRRLLRDVDAAHGAKLFVAAWAAFVFATTSAHSAAVIWLAAMSSLLVTAAVILLFRYVLAHETRLARPRVQIGAAALFLLVLACKNTAVTFPVVLGLYLLLLSPRRHQGGGRWRLVAMLSALGLTQVLVTKLVVGGIEIAAAFGERGAYHVGLNVPRNVLGAFLGAVLPARVYEWLLPGWPFPYVGLPLLLVFLAALPSLRFARGALFGVLWILVLAVPTSLFAYVQYSGDQIMASRYYYMPHVGFTISVAFVLLQAFRRVRRARWTAVLLVLAATGHAAFHSALVREAIDEQDAYGHSRMLLFESTLEAVQSRAPGASEVFAIGWPVPETYLAHIGELFFAPHGVTLRGPRAYEAFFANPPADDVKRFAAFWDREASVLTVRAVRGDGARP